jgi:hypothetical protein
MDEKTRKIWAGLVSYANGTATAAEIKVTIADCMGWVAATMLSDALDRIFVDEDPSTLSKEAEAYRPHVDNLLRVLCSEPKSEERNKLQDQALEFLREHGEHIRGLVLKEAWYTEEYLRNLNYTPDELENRKGQIKSILDQALPLSRFIPSRGYHDLADPICGFLSSEYEKYLNREVSRRDKKAPPLVPIFVCPSCKKLVMPERIGRRHHCSDCSDRARAEKYRQKASPDEGRDYAWLYRLQHQEPGTRRARLRQQKVKERLSEIKSRQRNSRRCQRLLQTLHR